MVQSGRERQVVATEQHAAVVLVQDSNVALGTLSSTGSGNHDGSNSSNLVVSAASDYALAAQPSISSVAGTITAATLTPSLSNAGVSKTYDGTTETAITPTYTFAGLVSGDTAATLSNTSKTYNSAHVVGANKVTVSGLSISAITGDKSGLYKEHHHPPSL